MKITDTLMNLKNNLARKKYGYYLVYTVIFAVMSLIVFMPFWINGKGFVWGLDGSAQHYPAFAYLGQWLREIIRTLFTEGRFEVPMWDFNIGYGSDIITSMNYYAIGDPLNLISVLIPTKWAELGYDCVILLRFYLSGLAFSLFCFKMNNGKTATLAGAFAYVFCGYAIYAGIKHAFFMNPMIYLPLMVLGAEKILRKERPILFIAMVCISAVSNFYFFYMCVIAVALYVIIRYFTMDRVKKSFKDFSVNILKFIGGGALGIGMAAAIFLPVVTVLFSSNRLEESGGSLDLVYSIKYYGLLIANMFGSATPDQWTCLGLAAPIFVAAIVMFASPKKYTGLKIGFCTMIVFMLFPVFGKILHGFSYVSNRWTFMFAALMAYILVSTWEDVVNITKTKFKVVATIFAIYITGLVVVLNVAATIVTYAVASIIALIIVIIAMNKLGYLKKYGKSAVSLILVFLTLCSVCVTSYFKYDGNQADYISEFHSYNSSYERMNNSGEEAMSDLHKEDENFERCDIGDYTYLNATALTGTAGTQYFWSLENGYISNHLFDNGYNAFYAQMYQGTNSRAYLGALASVEYYLKNSKQALPYGYEKYKTVTLGENDYKIYKNENPLPLGYTYSEYISREDYDNMSVAERQQATLQGVVLDTSETDLSAYSAADAEFTHKTITPEIELGKGVVLQEDGTFLVNKKKATITLTYEGLKDAETYLHLTGVKAETKTDYELYMDDCQEYYSTEEFESLSTSKKKEIKQKDFFDDEGKDDTLFPIKAVSRKATASIRYMKDEYRYSMGQDEFFVCLGYAEKDPQNYIKIKFPSKGVYSFDKIEVVCQPMNNFNEQVDTLKEDVLENEKIGTNSVEGTITLEEDKILCLSIPYTTGWTATVDGKETEILNANGMYMAIPLTAGTHDIKLNYTTPFMKAGLCITIVSFGIFTGMSTAYISIRRKRKKQHKVA